MRPFRPLCATQVTSEMLELVSRLRNPDTCTYSIAQASGVAAIVKLRALCSGSLSSRALLSQAHNPITQYMFKCSACLSVICAVCKDYCHSCSGCASPSGITPEAADSETTVCKHHILKPLGLVPSAFCLCNKPSCRALQSLDPREAAGFTWVPTPIDTGAVILNLEAGSELSRLVEKLAGNSHEVLRLCMVSSIAALSLLAANSPCRSGLAIGLRLDGSGVRKETTAKSSTRRSLRMGSSPTLTSSGTETQRVKRLQ